MTLLAMLGLLGAPVTAACPRAFTYILIADTAGELAGLGHPSLQVNGRAAFQAELDLGGSGIFAGRGFDDPVGWVLDDSLASNGFVLFGDPVIVGGSIAFWAQTVRTIEPLDPHGIYKALAPGSTQVVALERVASPTSDHMTVGRDPDLTAAGRVYFSSVLYPGTDTAIVRSPNERVASSATSSGISFAAPTVSATQGFFVFTSVDPVTFEKSIRWGPSITVRSDDSVAGTQVGDAPVVSDGGAVAYRHYYPTAPPPAPLEEQIVRWSPSTSGQTILADGAVDPLRDFASLSIGVSNCVAFRAFDEIDEVRKIFIADETGYSPVLAVGQPLFDGVVVDLEISKHSLSSAGDVAIWVLLSTGIGPNRELIVRADGGLRIFDDGFESGDTSRWFDPDS